MTPKTTTTPKYRPLNDRVLVLRSEQEESSPGGILLPDRAREKPTKGEVLAVGPGQCRDDGGRTAPSVRPGDLVLFGKYAGTEIPGHDGAVILKEDDILAVIEP